MTTTGVPPGTVALVGTFNVHLHNTSHPGFSSFGSTNFDNGWRFQPQCKQPPCTTQLRNINNKKMVVVLKRNGVSYTGSTTVAGLVTCQGHDVSTAITVTIHATQADAVHDRAGHEVRRHDVAIGERAARRHIVQRELHGRGHLAEALSATTLRGMDLASRLRASRAASSFTESVIREMTRLAQMHDAINLGQGFPDFPAPAEVKEAAARAIAEDHNQYPITWGVPAFRRAIASVYARDYGMRIDPETEICVTCGATEAMSSAFLGLLDPGDEVVVFEPFYESYGPDAILSGARLRYVTLRPPDWTFDPEELAAAFRPGTRAIVVGSPHNPTGKVFSRAELGQIAELCGQYDAIAITDEIYEHVTYDGARHIPIATMPGMAERTVTISALSKTYAVTGWRVGWAIAAAPLMAGIRATHDFLTVAAATPLQLAGVAALALPRQYYARTRAEYLERRDVMLRVLRDAGFTADAPAGAYYVMADVSALGFDDDTAAARYLVEQVGVAAVPGSSFFSEPSLGAHLLRFAFPKRIETLEEAGRRLRTARPNG